MAYDRYNYSEDEDVYLEPELRGFVYLQFTYHSIVFYRALLSSQNVHLIQERLE